MSTIAAHEPCSLLMLTFPDLVFRQASSIITILRVLHPRVAVPHFCCVSSPRLCSLLAFLSNQIHPGVSHSGNSTFNSPHGLEILKPFRRTRHILTSFLRHTNTQSLFVAQPVETACKASDHSSDHICVLTGPFYQSCFFEGIAMHSCLSQYLTLALAVSKIVGALPASLLGNDGELFIHYHSSVEQIPLAGLMPSENLDGGRGDTTSTSQEHAHTEPRGCFCAGGNTCCYLGNLVDCNFGICGLGV